jgi:catecholate siderophore receptor
MKLLNKLTKVATAALTIVFAAQEISGQDTEASSQFEDSEVLELEEFVVTGSSLFTNQVNALKTPTPIVDVPQSLSIVSNDEIIKRGFNSLGDIVDYTPGVNNSQGEGHRDAVVFRGVRSTADFFVDGVRDDIEYYRPLYNIEQVEILRGPNALFFGRGGTGGILNRVTKKGIIGEDFNAYTFSSDSFGATEVQLDSNATINEKAAFRLNLFYESLENHRDYFDGDRYGANPTFKFQLDENTTLDLSYEYIDHEHFIDRGIPTGANNKPVEDFEKIVFGDPELNESTLEAHVVRALLQHNFSDSLKANFSASYGDYDKFYQNLYVSAYNQSVSPDQVTLDGYNDATDRKNTVLSGNLIGEFFTADIEHTVIFGAEYINTSSDQNRFNTFWNTTNTDTEAFAPTRPLSINGGTGVNASGAATTVTFSDLNDDTRADIDVYSFYFQASTVLISKLKTLKTELKAAKKTKRSLLAWASSTNPRKTSPFTQVTVKHSFLRAANNLQIWAMKAWILTNSPILKQV